MPANKGAIILGAVALGGLMVFLSGRARAEPEPGQYICPYCGVIFDTYEELVLHCQEQHPGQRIPIEIIWD